MGLYPRCNLFLHITCSCIARFNSFLYCALPFVVTLFLSFLSLSFSLLIMAPKTSIPSKNSIHHGSSSSSFPPDSVRFHDEKARVDFSENFSDQAIHSECQVILSGFPNTPLPVAISFRGWASLYEKPSRCPDVFIKEFYSNMHAIDTFVPLFITVFHGTRIIVTLNFISEVLHVPRVDYPDYPSYPRFTSISRDELASLFCENAMLWGGTLNFSTTKFTKGPRFLNMVITFVLTPRSHYNTITEPHALFLLSFMEGLSIDFPSHMIESIIDCYCDMATYDKLIFPSAITRILTHMHITIPPSPHFYVIGAISKESIWWSAAQLTTKRPWVEPSDAASADPSAPSSHPFSSSTPSSLSRATVSLTDIME